MSTGPIFDHFWLFALGVVTAPLAAAAATVAAARWRASVRGFELDANRWSLFAVVVGLYLLMLVGGGLLLDWLRGIPPGIGVLGVLGFLLAVYAGPLTLGATLFGRFVSSRLSAPGTDRPTASAVTESCALFVGLHLAVFPTVWVVAIVAS